MSKELDALTAQVRKNEEVVDSAVVLLKGLSARIAELKTDPVALQALSDELKAKTEVLSMAIIENTPAE